MTWHPLPLFLLLFLSLPQKPPQTPNSLIYMFFFPLFFSFLLTQLNSFFLLLCSALLSLFPRSLFFLVFSCLSFNFPRNTLMVFAFFCSLSAFSEYSLSRDWSFKKCVLLYLQFFFLHFPLLRRNYLIFLTSLFPGKVERLQKLGFWIESEILLSLFPNLLSNVCLWGKKNTEVWSCVSVNRGAV